MPSLGTLLSELERAVRLRLRESPLLTFAAAGGLGYVLGRGLTVGALSRALQVGLRVALTSRAEQALIDWLTIGRRRESAREAAHRSRGRGDSR